MKTLQVQSVALGVLLIATPVLAQANNQPVEEGAGIIAWIIVGLIGGFLASKVVNRRGEGVFRDMILGIIGGLIGGFIFRAFGSRGVTGFNLWSILVAFIGAVVLLVLYHAVRGQRARA